jgi:hypothetical protein
MLQAYREWLTKKNKERFIQSALRKHPITLILCNSNTGNTRVISEEISTFGLSSTASSA